MSKLKYKKLCLKISGEALMGDGAHGVIDPVTVQKIASQIVEVKKLGCEISVVIGGGNIIRGDVVAKQGIDRSTADYMGMLSTIFNGLALQDAIEKMGRAVKTAVCTDNKRSFRALYSKKGSSSS